MHYIYYYNTVTGNYISSTFLLLHVSIRTDHHQGVLLDLAKLLIKF